MLLYFHSSDNLKIQKKYNYVFVKHYAPGGKKVQKSFFSSKVIILS